MTVGEKKVVCKQGEAIVDLLASTVPRPVARAAGTLVCGTRCVSLSLSLSLHDRTEASSMAQAASPSCLSRSRRPFGAIQRGAYNGRYSVAREKEAMAD